MDYYTKRTHDALDYLPRKPLTQYADSLLVNLSKKRAGPDLEPAHKCEAHVAKVVLSGARVTAH